MSNSWILVNDGVGGSLLGLQAAHFMRKYDKWPVFLCPYRDEVFKPFEYLVKDLYECWQVPENQPNLLLNHGKRAIGIDKEDELYLIYPDGLYRNPFAFDYRKYDTNPQLIRSTRVLTHQYAPRDKNVYLGLISSTAGYSYYDVPGLIKWLSKLLPEYIFHLPIVSKWANIDINLGDLSDLPKNVIKYENDDFCNQINILKTCEYCICLDNGISHIAYNLGIPRLLLDSRFGFGRNSNPWVARWKEDINESVRIESFPQSLADLVKLNLTVPQTTLLPRQVVLNNLYTNWTEELLLKF